MKKYEAIIILNPNLSSKVGDFTKKFEKLLTENSFSVKKCEDIGRRQLSYSINNHNKGHYLIFNIEGYPIKLIDVENKIKYDESIIRHLFMSVKEHSVGDSKLFLDSKNNKHEIEDDDNETTSKSKDSKPEQDNDASNKDSHQSEDDEISNEDQKEEPSTDNIDKEKDDE
jgi:small subunit ribosomal protein S6